MKKDFDFDDIGKKTPYRVPEGFFDEMQREVQKSTYADKSSLMDSCFHKYCRGCGVNRLSVHAVSFPAK